MTIKQLLLTGTKTLQKEKISSASLDAEILLSHVLKKPKEYLYTYPEKELSQKNQVKFLKLIEKRKQSMPVAYLTGKKEFYGLDFFINKNVLIPRPETELLVDCALEIIKKSKQKTIAFADIGCGSGAIAVAIAKNIGNKKAHIYASDISAKALAVAKKNAKNHGAKIIFKKGDLLEPFAKVKTNIVVANLPYLAEKDKKTLLQKTESKAIKYEPKTALFAGKDGLDLYCEFFDQIKDLKNKPAYIIIEIGQDQVEKAEKIIKNSLKKAKIKPIVDSCYNSHGLLISLS